MNQANSIAQTVNAGVKFSCAFLEGANFAGADLRGFDPRTIARRERHCTRCDDHDRTREWLHAVSREVSALRFAMGGWNSCRCTP